MTELDEIAANRLLDLMASAMAAGLDRKDTPDEPGEIRASLTGPLSICRPIYEALRSNMPEANEPGVHPHALLEGVEGGLARVTAWAEVE